MKEGSPIPVVKIFGEQLRLGSIQIKMYFPISSS